MPDDVAGLLGRLLSLSRQLEAQLEAHQASDPPDAELEQLAPFLAERALLLAQLAELPEAQRQLDDHTRPLFDELNALGEKLLASLEIRRGQVSSNQSTLRNSYSAMQAYLPASQAESYYFEDES